MPYTDSRTSLQQTDIGDYQIRLNDHPYAFTPDITHIVVWSAMRFPEGLGKEERDAILKRFVEEHFGEIPLERRCWFTNPEKTQSVPGLEVGGIRK